MITSTNEIRFRVSPKHVKGCLAKENASLGLWEDAWAGFIEGEVNTKHGKNGKIRWAAIPCNDPDCDAKLLFQVRDLELLAPRF